MGRTVYENLAKISNGRIYNLLVNETVNIELNLNDVHNQLDQHRATRNIAANHAKQPEISSAETKILIAEGEPLLIKCHINSQNPSIVEITHDGQQLKQWTSKYV